MDKDDGTITDDYIGSVDTTLEPGAKELTIEGPTLRRVRGTFWLKVCNVQKLSHPHSRNAVSLDRSNPFHR